MKCPLKKWRGITLVEMLVSIAIVALATGAVTRVYVGALALETKAGQTRETRQKKISFEDSVSRLISGASLAGASHYFVSPIPTSTTGIQPHFADSPLGEGSSTLGFTSGGESIPQEVRLAKPQDFSSLNTQYGPVAGFSEVALSTQAVGEAGARQGLFLREQFPPDDDLTQGGQERDLNETILDIRYEFFDGTTWQTTWDSRNAQKDTIPSAVRVTYLNRGDNHPHQFFVRLPLSTLAPGGAK